MSQNDEKEIARRHVTWTGGWERRDGDPEFAFERTFAELYDWKATDGLYYDDFDPEHRVAHTPAEYGTIWTPAFNAVRSAHHAVVAGPSVIVDRDLAVSSLTFAARIEPLERPVALIRTTTTLVWRRRDDGWRIVREHNSTQLLDEAEYEAVTTADGAYWVDER